MLLNILGQKGKVVLKYLGEKRRGRKAKGHLWAKRVPPLNSEVRPRIPQPYAGFATDHKSTNEYKSSNIIIV